ncbi:MAG TPA: hypothetical protein VEI80_06250 [Candidatus Acidoferrales bacterium]|nr:hypothetical protein [Candidatus Acidoferrales bacterium]
MYKLKGQPIPARNRRLSEKLGYSGDSRFYRILRRKLMREGVLDRTGRFIEDQPNLWLAKFLDYVPSRDAGNAVGYRIPYNCFLALLLSEVEFASRYQLAKELKLNYVSTYSAMRSLARRGVISEDRVSIGTTELATHLSYWFKRYLAIIVEQARITEDTSRIFKTVSAYIDGLEAIQRVNYEPGMPVGPAPMIIRTYSPYLGFWRHTIQTVEHWAKRGEQVKIDLAKKGAKIIWIAGLPYAQRPIA